MLIDLFRKFLPIKVRQNLGLWLISQVAKSKWLLYPYYKMLYGDTPKNLKLLPRNECVVEYNNHLIYAPRDGILAFIEVFQDKVYEKVWAIQPRDIVVDVGAYVGMFTIKASDIVGEGGRIYAIEPEPHNLAYLAWNVRDTRNVIVIPVVVGSKIGKSKLYISSASPCHTIVYHHKNWIEVDMITLDSLNIQPDFVKIDAEGSELEILKGAENVIEKGTRFAIACYHNLPGGDSELETVISFLKDRGYKTTIIHKYVFAEKESK